MPPGAIDKWMEAITTGIEIGTPEKPEIYKCNLVTANCSEFDPQLDSIILLPIERVCKSID